MNKKSKKFNINDHKAVCEKEVASLNEDDKKQINEFANKLIEKIQSDKEQINDSEDINFEKIRWKDGIFCPWCKSKEYCLNGQNKKAKRYKCKNKICNKSFSFMSNSFLSGSNLSLHQWSTYIKCFTQIFTCKQAAAMTGIHLVTAWKNRHKVLKWLIQLVAETKLSGNIILVEFFAREVYKGRWKSENKPKRLIEKQKFYETRKRKMRGLSRFKVCFMTGINEKKEFFFKIAKFGKISFQKASEILDEMLEKINQIISDKEQVYKKYAAIKK